MKHIRREVNRWAGILGLTLALAVPTPAQAQSPAPQAPTKITFVQALDLALRQSVDVRKSENAAALSSATVQEQKLQFLPSLSIKTSGSQNIGRTFSETEGSIVNQSTSALTAGISSSVTLFNGLSNVASLKQANLAENASQQDLTRARQTAAFTVASNFLTVISDQEQLGVQQENLSAQQALEAQISKLVQAGARSISDLYQQQAVVASARSSVTSAKRDLEVAKVQLIQTLQLEPGGTYDFVPPAIQAGDTSAAFNLDSLLARAYANRTDLAAASSRVSAANQGVKAASGGRWPSLALTAGYNSSFNSATDLDLLDQLDQRRGGSVALQVTVPLFDNGQTGLATERARIDQENAQLALEDQRRTIGLEVRRAYLDYDAAREQLAAAEAQLKASNLAVTTAQKRYQAGAGTLVELAQARATQVQAASAVVTARYTLVFQGSLMPYYTGEFDPQHLTLQQAAA
jgi:outer membrane protein